MAGFAFKSTGSWDRTERWMKKMERGAEMDAFEVFGRRGVDALAHATPRDTGLTAESWGYRVTRKKGFAQIEWFNTNAPNGVLIAILIQYGHGTGTGGYVSGEDYINPAMRPIFDEIVHGIWKEVTA